jgi:hypothetical protein
MVYGFWAEKTRDSPFSKSPKDRSEGLTEQVEELLNPTDSECEARGIFLHLISGI